MGGKGHLFGAMVIAGCGLLTACQSPYGPTLADLEPRDREIDQLEPITLPVVEVNRPDADALFRAALAITDDPDDQRIIKRRLAALALRKGDEADAAGRVSSLYYEQAVERYQGLLRDYPDSPDNDYLLYQLAKASELSGDPERAYSTLQRLITIHPDSQFTTEAYFRRGEMQYTQKRYFEAADSYDYVVDQGEATPFYQNALYMRGWSYFKQGEHVTALDSFALILDDMIPASGKLEEADEMRRSMLEDTLRVASLSITYEQGVETLDAVFGPRDSHYVHLLYETLAQHYLDKERYRDTAETYEHFIQRYPDSRYAPEFSAKVVETYVAGGFPSLAAPAMQNHVENYGINSAYWAAADESLRNSMRPQLAGYLDQLARHEHAQAQQAKDRNKGVVGAKSRSHFRAAIGWYEEFIATAPTDDRAEEMLFLMGESYYEVGEYGSAADAYERVAYPTGERAGLRGAEAGYAAITSYEQQMAILAKKPPSAARQEEISNWRQRKIDSAFRFAGTYPEDPRSLTVMGRIGEELLAQKDYDRAVEVAKVITEHQDPVPKELSATAWLVTGQARFAQENYAEAEKAFSNALDYIDEDSPQWMGVIERLAASAYKAGEAALAAGDKEAAAESFMRVAIIAPAASIAGQAQTDAVALFVQLERWDRAESVVRKLLRDETDPDIVVDLRIKLAEIYIKQEKYAQAAAEYDRIAKTGDDPDNRRKATYLSAELYQKGGATGAAIQAYKRYIKRYPDHFDTVMEARFHLVELFDEGGRDKEKRYWMEQLVEGHEDAGRAATDRSRYLAASAMVIFADDAYKEYAEVGLVLPLKASFKRKRKVMKEALAAYEQLLGYQVDEFSSLARYRIADIYATMGAELLDSDRPATLDPDGLMQYEMVLEEQAYPMEEKAIEVHETNIRLARSGDYNEWVVRSYEALAALMPVRYNKQERTVKFSNRMY